MPAIDLSPMSGISIHRIFSCPRALTAVIIFLVLWILSETLQKEAERLRPNARIDSLHFAASDIAKSAFSLFIWVIWRWVQRVHPLLTMTASTCSCPACNRSFRDQQERIPISRNSSCSPCRDPYSRTGAGMLTLGSMRSALFILVVAIIYALHAYTDLRTRQFVDSVTLSLSSPVTFSGILILIRVIFWRSYPFSFWHAIVLQFAGFFIARDVLVGSAIPPWNFLLTFALCNSLEIFLADVVYGLHRSSSVHLINTIMFAQSFFIHLLVFLLDHPHDIPHSYSHYNQFGSVIDRLPFIEAARDVTALFIIQQYGAISLGILVSLASSLLLFVDTWRFIQAPSPAFLGCLVALFGCGIFIFCGEDADEHQHDFIISTRRCIVAATISMVTLGYIITFTSQSLETYSSESPPPWKNFSESFSEFPSGDSDHCHGTSSNLPHTQTIGNYTSFENVLLIVFFSHARYDGNLDFHREVYSNYFPNIIYVGPASREDKGFAHSYDVLVDSYQSDEDLSDPAFYKMAGRMAHHMLYTALKEYDCYEGYLWAPFDTFLNVPRLQQFDQNLFWYHSPWGNPVPNPALSGPPELVLDKSRHAPPAMISPDLSINLTETWRGWGLDWWWGDPHVGVSICMDAFRRVPEDMRARLAERTNGQARLIGGSADTLYIPGRHRKAFMDVLGLFLETDCFLEIATPTAVHLVVSPGEPIQFVDHWWIYQSPFDASFVRQKWAQGYEVDTFHTFHWGERGQDGVWRGDHRHVSDVRHLLRESAMRQGLGDTFMVNLDRHYTRLEG